MKMVECQNCNFKFEVDENRANVMCPKCKKNVNLLFEKITSEKGFRCGNCENLPKN